MLKSYFMIVILFEDYRKKLADGVSPEESHMLKWAAEIRSRIGFFADTVEDRDALATAAKFRSERLAERRVLTETERERLTEKVLQRLRDRAQPLPGK